MDTEGQELGPYEPVPDTLVLAAIERAVCQGPGTVWPVHLGEHLGFSTISPAELSLPAWSF